MNSLKVALVASAVCFFAARSVAGTYYVDYENGNDSTDGTAEGAGAWQTLAHAVATAEAESEIVLATGTHPIAANVVVEKALTLRGAGAPEETQIDGNGGNWAVRLKVAGATLCGVTLTNMKGDWNAALTVETGAVASNVLFTALAKRYGVGIELKGGLITCCRFVNNENLHGNFIEISNGTMENCLVASNEVQTLIAITRNAADAVVRNSTIVDNTCTEVNYALNLAAKAHVCNNIIWGNVNSLGTANWTKAENTDNCINNCTTPVDGLIGSGNISDDPMFFSDGTHIKSVSPCNHKANPAYATTVDIDGRARGGEPSIGAFEYVDIGELEVAIQYSAKVACLPDTITLTPVVVGVPEEEISYSWDLKGDRTMITTEKNPVLAVPGYYTPSLTVTAGSREPTVVSLTAPLAVRAAGAQSYYVNNETGDDLSDGLTPQSAWKTLNAAIASAMVENGDEIVLEPGTHPIALNVVVDKTVTIRGAGEPGETQIDGNAKNVSVSLKVAGATLRNLTLQNMKGDWNPSLTTEAGTVVSNVVLTGLSNGGREGILVNGGVISGCRFVLNSHSGSLMKISSGTVENCLVMSNTVGSVFQIWGPSTIIRNSTIVNNTLAGAGYALDMGYKVKVYNNIIWNNVNASGTANWTGANNAENWIGNCTTPVDGLPAAGGNIGDDPAFFSDGYHIKSTSPCNHKANPAYATTVDIDGFPRGGTPSIGAFEYVDIGELEVSISPSATFVSVPETITLTPVVVGAPAGEVSYQWDLKGDGTMMSAAEKPVLSAAGIYMPTLTVTIGDGAPVVVSLGSPLVIHPNGAQTYYVDGVAGDNARDGMTQQTAWQTLSYAIRSSLVAAGDEILLAKGLHPLASNLEVAKAITIRGAGAPGETQIDGNAKNVSVSLKVAGATLRDVTLQNTKGDWNPPLQTVAGTVVSNVVLTGVANDYHEMFKLDGGLITACRFVSNVHPNGGTMFKISGTTMENCLIADNSVSDVFNFQAGAEVLRNSTVVGNTCKGDGVAVKMDVKAQVCNNIIRDNVNAAGTANWKGSAVNVVNWSHNCTTQVEGLPDSMNFDADPLFSTKHAYHLTAASPCRNAGSDELAATGVDLDGRPRKVGRHVDLGCFELGGMGMSVLVR